MNAPFNISNPVEFVKALDLDHPSGLDLALLGSQPPVLKDNEKSANVDAGSLVSFVASLGTQNKSDVLNSTLLAQLAANKQFDRWTKPIDWYNFYTDVLAKVGWVFQAFDFQRYQAGGSTFTVDEVVLKVLAAIATQNEIAIAKETMDALKALSDGKKGLVLWDSNSSSAQAGNFQISVCNESNGSVVMKNGSFYFSTTETTKKFLWFSYSGSSMNINKSGTTLTLDGEIYSKVRQQIIDKLGSKASEFVADLDI